MYDVLIVGSGPTGTAAAYGLRGRDVLMVDVGHCPPGVPPLDGNLYRLRRTREDLFEPLIGTGLEGLYNLHSGKPISLKLKAPYMTYVVRDWQSLCPVASRSFEPVLSFAKGGLANAWGAGVYRFTRAEFHEFPIDPAEMDAFYGELTAHMGISGWSDDLDRFFGNAAGLMPPLRISSFYRNLLKQYSGRKASFHEHGIFVGYPRLAVLTEPLGNRIPYRYENLEFFKPYNPAVYNPAFTIDEMISARQLRYESGYMVTSYRETDTGVDVFALNLRTQTTQTFCARRLILAAGALSTAKIVLQSHADYETRLPILDNPMSCIPFFRFGQIGEALDIEDTSFGQLNLVYEDRDSGEVFQGTFYGSTGPLRSDVLFQFPLAISAGLTWARYLAPAMGLLMLFYPGKHSEANYLKLRANGELEIEYHPQSRGEIEKRLIRALRKLGYLSAPAICRYPAIGNSLHYAGTLPMKSNPSRYETDASGLLAGTRNVYVVDGAVLPSLPSKNLTFTTMANAMRVARKLRSRLG